MSTINTRNMLYTIGGPETTAGTAVARTAVIPIRDKPSFREQAEKTEDPAITGENMPVGEYMIARDLSGGIPISPRPCAAMGMLINSLLGQESAPSQIGAVIRIRYSGSDASCKISADTTGDTLTSDTGALGSESGDENFGTTGDLDLTAVGSDTVAEVVSTVDAYDDYEAELVTGLGTLDAADIIDITSEQGKDRWVYVYFSSESTSLYLHQWPVVLTNTARDHYSIQADGVHDNFLAAGVVIDSMSMSGALKSMVEAEVQGLGMTYTGSETASSVTLEAVDPFIFYDGSFSIGGNTEPYIRNIGIEVNNNHGTEGYGMGSASRQYVDKGVFDVTVDLQTRHDTDIYTLRADIFDNDQSGLDIYFQTASYLGTASDEINGLLIIEIPFCNISDYDIVDNNGVLDASLNLRAMNPPSQYGSPFRISMITDDSSAY